MNPSSTARPCAPGVVLLLALAAAISPAWLRAQLGTGSITGSVSDTTGAVVIGARITATNTANNFTRQTVSNEAGQYTMAGLTPGSYNLQVEYEGFKSYRQTGLTLQVDQVARIDIALEVGELTESVEVAAEAPLIQSENASMGAVIEQRKITDLPLNGRQFRQLALLVPGANTGAPGADNGGGFTVSGLRAEQNAFQIDGTSNSDAFQNRITIQPNIDAIQEFKIQTNNYSAEFGKGAGAQVNLVTRSGTTEFHGTVYEFLRNDAVQARRLFDNNRTSFPCDPNDSNVSGRAACAPPWNQNQFGATFGGPLTPGSRPRTFFFAAYEGFRLRRGAAGRQEVPTLAQRAGDLSQNIQSRDTVADAAGRVWKRGQIFDPLTSTQVTDPNTNRLRFIREPFVNNMIPLTRFDPVSQRMLNNTTFVPLPNADGARASDGNFRDNFLDGRSRINDTDQFQTRIDRQFTDSDTVYGRFTINDATGFSPNSFPGFGTNDDTRNLNGTLSWSRVISPATLNEMRFGYQGWFQLNGSEDLGTDWHGMFGITGFGHLSPDIQGSPSVGISGFTGLGNGGGPLRRRNNTFQFIDNFSFSKGNHFLKAGIEIRRVRENVTRAQTTRGDFSFSNPQWTGIDGVGGTGHALANMILGLTRQKARRVSDFYSSLRSTEWGAYIQDDWKVSPNLTLNIGLRYMLYQPPYDKDDQLSTMVFNQRCPSYDACSTKFVDDTFLDSSPFVPFWGVAEGTAAAWNAQPLPRALSPTDKKNFGPRFGFAWRPFGGNDTVIRGGYGIFYDTVPMILTEDTIENWPYVVEDQQDISLFQNGLPPAEGFFGFLIESPGLRTGPTPRIAGFQPGPNVFAADFRNAYVQSWNFGIQRQLPANMIFEIAYAGNKGTALNRRQNTNTAEPLGINSVVGDLTNDDSIRSDIGGGRNQFRRLVPAVVQDGVIVAQSNIFETTSTALSNYHGLQLRLEKRYSSGLTLLTTYTWSKAISDASGFNDGGDAGTGNRIQNIFNVQADKGLADSDHRHRFTTAWVYDLPFGRGRKFGAGASGVVQRLIGGWGVDGISSLQSGYPITVRRSGDPGSMGTDGALRPDITCDPDIPRGQQTIDMFFRTDCFVRPESLISGDVRFGTAGRTTVQGPGIINFDISLRKVTDITEKVNIEFRAEFFNSFNHPNWLLTGSRRDFGNSAFGTINDTLDPRIIQFGLKLKF